MTGSTLILMVAMICQLPGGDGPARTWHDVTIAGKTTKVLGWTEGGFVRFWPHENPQLQQALTGGPTPSPSPAAPTPAAPIRASSPATSPPTGVIADKMPSVRPGAAWYGGNAGPSVQAAGDEARRVHLTVIGTRPEREAFRRDLAGGKLGRMAEAMGDRLAVQDYDPSNPMVAGVGLPDGGKPDVVIQDATGKEVFRRHKNPGGDAIEGEIRKIAPDYKPARDDEAPHDGAEYGWIAAGAIGAFLVYRSLKKANP